MQSTGKLISSALIARCLNNYKAEFTGPATGFSYKIPVGSIMNIHKNDAAHLRALESNNELFPTI